MTTLRAKLGVLARDANGNPTDYGLALYDSTGAEVQANEKLGGTTQVTLRSGTGLVVNDGTYDRVIAGNLGSSTYGLKVSNGAGTVIIDGSSDIFKIGATGTLTINPGPANGNNITVFVDNIAPDTGSWPSNNPANSWFTQGEALPYVVLNLANGTITQMQEGFTSAGTLSGVKASFRWGSYNAGVTGNSATVRYYIFSEATI